MTSASAAFPGQLDPDPDGLLLRRIDRPEHSAFARTHAASILQTPDWAAVKPGWRSESLGWFQDDVLVGAALVLYRPVPGSRRSLAYVPEGPTLPWSVVSAAPQRWLGPFVAHLRTAGAFAVRLGPALPVRIWHAPTARRGLTDPQIHRFAELEPDENCADGAILRDVLRSLGWQPTDPEVAAEGETGARDQRAAGFGGGQPRFSVRLELAGRTTTQLLAETNQQWRRNLGRSVRAGVVVREGRIDDLAAFHRLYLLTAERDGFVPRPAEHFTAMWRALAGGPTPLRLYLAEYGPEQRAQAAAIVVQVGETCWYSYGASSAEHREVQASTAVQWHAICDAQARGCRTYDLRGIADTLDPADSLTGLLRFKLGIGGTCVETVGEWELTLSKFWHRAFRLYWRLRP